MKSSATRLIVICLQEPVSLAASIEGTGSECNYSQGLKPWHASEPFQASCFAQSSRTFKRCTQYQLSGDQR